MGFWSKAVMCTGTLAGYVGLTFGAYNYGHMRGAEQALQSIGQEGPRVSMEACLSECRSRMEELAGDVGEQCSSELQSVREELEAARAMSQSNVVVFTKAYECTQTNLTKLRTKQMNDCCEQYGEDSISCYEGCQPLEAEWDRFLSRPMWMALEHSCAEKVLGITITDTGTTPSPRDEPAPAPRDDMRPPRQYGGDMLEI
ncbi:hypothetical protein KY362_05685 [Candidatus Woesearchaeota archaeon]|nr:hypothetical protein [Candidatus Woesearchaeota archaeon]